MKIALFGYGKMGKEIEKIAISRGHKIGLKVDENNVNSFSKSELKQCDVAIEFSTPHTAVANILTCFDANIPIVVGTTGWYNQLTEIEEICKQKNGCLFYASNFSIGVNLFFKLNETLSKLMSNYNDYAVSIEEIHHIHKLDSPSGTAISIANQIINTRKDKVKWVNSPTLKLDELEIISKREAEVPGTHSVKYHSVVDDIEIIHQAHNRKGFALGAVLAAEFSKEKKGILGMKNLLNL